MFIPAITAAAIGGLGSIIGGIVGANGQKSANQANLQAARETNQMNYKIFQEQKQYNTDMMNAQNAYNTPIAQRARYEEAGINPYLALGNISSGVQQSSLTAPNAPNMVTPQVQPVTSMAQGLANASNAYVNNYVALANAKADIRAKNAAAQGKEIENLWLDTKLQTEIDNMRKSGVKLDKENIGLGLQNDFNTAVLDTNIAQAEANLRESNERIRNLDIKNKLDNLNFELENKYAEKRVKATIANIMMQTDTGYYNAKTNRINADTNRYNAVTNRITAISNVSLVRAQINKINAECFQIAENIKKTVQERHGIELSNQQMEELMPLIYSQAYNNALSSKNEADKAEFFYNLRNGKYGSIAKFGHIFVEYVGTTLGNVGSIVGNVLGGAKGK